MNEAIARGHCETGCVERQAEVRRAVVELESAIGDATKLLVDLERRLDAVLHPVGPKPCETVSERPPVPDKLWSRIGISASDVLVLRDRLGEIMDRLEL